MSVVLDVHRLERCSVCLHITLLIWCRGTARVRLVSLTVQGADVKNLCSDLYIFHLSAHAINLTDSMCHSPLCILPRPVSLQRD